MGWRDELDWIVSIGYGLNCGATAGLFRAKVLAIAAGDHDEVDRLSDGWYKAASEVDDHQKAVQSAVTASTSCWTGSAAEGFQDYMIELVGKLENHKSAMNDTADALDDLQGLLEEGEKKAESIVSDVWKALRDAAIYGAAGAAAGALGSVAGAVLGGSVGAAASAIINGLGIVEDVQQEFDQKKENIKDTFDKLSGVVDSTSIRELSPPAKPSIVTQESFSSIHFESVHEPENLPETTIDKDPSVKAGVDGRGHGEVSKGARGGMG